MKPGRLFRTHELDFEATRILWTAPAGGADFGEVRAALAQIREGDYESWHRAWADTAARVSAPRTAAGARGRISQGQALLRANRYWAAAEFFLPPADPRKLSAYQAAAAAFAEAVELLEIDFEEGTVDFEGAPLRTWRFPSRGPATAGRGTLLVCGGFDALLEELYYVIGHQATLRGWDVVMFEGPGQSDVLRYHGAPFTPDWHLVARAALEHWGRRLGGGPVIGVGLSLGGHLMLRAGGLAPGLLDGLVAWNYFPGLTDTFKDMMPAFLHPAIDRGALPRPLHAGAQAYIRSRRYFNWQIEHSKWVFAARDVNQLLSVAARFDEGAWVERIQAPTLILVSEREHFYNPARAERLASRLNCPHRLVTFTEAEGGQYHCANGAHWLPLDTILAWADGIVGA
ncbi:MAG: lysophospholipase [Bifidobacteriaceae bacterium]|jgi:pimeloyl-ACP methyl ester carboxylesterase|nr:lysophospholipase [Bifidobacteriaceae bacterium]